MTLCDNCCRTEPLTKFQVTRPRDRIKSLATVCAAILPSDICRVSTLGATLVLATRSSVPAPPPPPPLTFTLRDSRSFRQPRRLLHPPARNSASRALPHSRVEFSRVGRRYRLITAFIKDNVPTCMSNSTWCFPRRLRNLIAQVLVTSVVISRNCKD